MSYFISRTDYFSLGELLAELLGFFSKSIITTRNNYLQAKFWRGGGGRKERHLRFFSHHVSSSSRFNKWQGCPLVVRKRVAAIYSQPNAGLWKVSSIVLPSNVLASSCRKEPDRSEIITYRCPNSHPYSWRSKQNGNSVCSLTEVLTW